MQQLAHVINISPAFSTKIPVMGIWDSGLPLRFFPRSHFVLRLEPLQTCELRFIATWRSKVRTAAYITE